MQGVAAKNDASYDLSRARASVTGQTTIAASTAATPKTPPPSEKSALGQGSHCDPRHSPQQMDTRGIEQTGFSECRQAELDAVLQGQIRSSRQLARSTGQLPRTRHLTTACSWQGAAMGLCRGWHHLPSSHILNRTRRGPAADAGVRPQASASRSCAEGGAWGSWRWPCPSGRVTLERAGGSPQS